MLTVHQIQWDVKGGKAGCHWPCPSDIWLFYDSYFRILISRNIRWSWSRQRPWVFFTCMTFDVFPYLCINKNGVFIKANQLPWLWWKICSAFGGQVLTVVNQFGSCPPTSLIMHPSNTVYLTLGKWVIVAKEHVYSYLSSCASVYVFVPKYNFCG